MRKKKDSCKVLFFSDQMEMAAGSLSPHDCGRLFEMVRVYRMNGIETDVSTESRSFRSLYQMMCRKQDEDKKDYRAKSEEARKHAYMRWHPEAYGGMRTHAKDANPKQTNPKQTKSRQNKSIREGGSAEDDDSIKEIKGVPGVAWM